MLQLQPDLTPKPCSLSICWTFDMAFRTDVPRWTLSCLGGPGGDLNFFQHAPRPSVQDLAGAGDWAWEPMRYAGQVTGTGTGQVSSPPKLRFLQLSRPASPEKRDPSMTMKGIALRKQLSTSSIHSIEELQIVEKFAFAKPFTGKPAVGEASAASVHEAVVRVDMGDVETTVRGAPQGLVAADQANKIWQWWSHEDRRHEGHEGHEGQDAQREREAELLEETRQKELQTRPF